MNELRDAFALFDKEGKGVLKASEIGDLARAMGTDCTIADANKITGGHIYSMLSSYQNLVLPAAT